jgi:hypothetical protein
MSTLLTSAVRPAVREMFQSWHSSLAPGPVEFAVRVAGCFPTQGGGTADRTVSSWQDSSEQGRCGRGCS